MHPLKLLGLGLSIVVSGSAWAGSTTQVPRYEIIAWDSLIPQQQATFGFVFSSGVISPVSQARMEQEIFNRYPLLADSYQQAEAEGDLDYLKRPRYEFLDQNSVGLYAGYFTAEYPTDSSFFKGHGFVYDPSADSFRFLDQTDYTGPNADLPDSYVLTRANAINDAGAVVGKRYELDDDGDFGLYWAPGSDTETLLLDLIDLASSQQFLQRFQAEHGEDSSYMVRDALAINETGDIYIEFGGTDISNNAFNGFGVLRRIDHTPGQVIPTPGAAVAGLALMGGMAMRRRR